ncbi:MAG: energy transducer TonB [Proteobacteria bacterium]|nr:energy transducer TonB [Pseudomonadota bacterium]MBU4469320.1 energy transducer TonB [Pseudomonadota bacterium]MCG2750799.1 energy transducer TonB [Desulfobacteraceae bacterium]
MRVLKYRELKTEWLFAVLLALVINGVLFGLMPALQSGVKENVALPALQNAIDIFRLKRPDPPPPAKEKPQPEEEAKPPEKKIVQRDLFQHPLSEKPRLPFEVNDKLPSGPGMVPTLDLEKYDLHGGGTGLFEERDLDKPIQLLADIKPLYPLRAKRMNITGWVKVRFVVTKAGRVANAEVLESEPAGVFDNSVLNAVSAWRFSPPMVAGEPVDTAFTRKITFNFDDE